jgi:hypothetical protein
MAKDVDLFKAAMAGVKPLRGRKPRSGVIARPKAEGSRKPQERSLASLGMTEAALEARGPARL